VPEISPLSGTPDQASATTLPAPSAAARQDLAPGGRLRPVPEPRDQARDAGARADLASFIEAMKADGFVAASLQRHKIEGASIAPPDRLMRP